MEVTIPQAQPGELDFSDPGVLFQEWRQGDQDFNMFLEEETSQLRALLLARNPRNRDAYENLFDASTSIVRNTLEMIWYDKQDCNNLRKGALQLEEKKKEMGRKLNEYKREIELPGCEITGLRKFNQTTFQIEFHFDFDTTGKDAECKKNGELHVMSSADFRVYTDSSPEPNCRWLVSHQHQLSSRNANLIKPNHLFIALLLLKSKIAFLYSYSTF